MFYSYDTSGFKKAHSNSENYLQTFMYKCDWFLSCWHWSAVVQECDADTQPAAVMFDYSVRPELMRWLKSPYVHLLTDFQVSLVNKFNFSSTREIVSGEHLLCKFHSLSINYTVRLAYGSAPMSD